MAEDGIYGYSDTSTAPVALGLAYWLNAEGVDVALAVRGYNTGSVTDSYDLTDVATGTPAYVSDIANRLVGGLVGSLRPCTCWGRLGEKGEGKGVLVYAFWYPLMEWLYQTCSAS